MVVKANKLQPAFFSDSDKVPKLMDGWTGRALYMVMF